MNIIIYKRLSKEKKGGSQYGFDSQQADINLFLNQQKEYTVVAEYQEFFSGKDSWTKRPELVKAVKHAEETGSVLLVSKVDRLGRDVESVAHLLKKEEVRIATMPSANNMTVQLLAVMAEEEARAISARTKAALAQAKAQGKKIGGAAIKHQVARMKGYKKLVERDQHYVNKLQSFRNKGYTMERIADVFNDMGYTTPKGCQHNKSSVYRLCCKYGIV